MGLSFSKSGSRWEHLRLRIRIGVSQNTEVSNEDLGSMNSL